MNFLGPLFPFELRRIVRKHRPFAARVGYLTGLLAVLALTYLTTFENGPKSLSDYLFRTDPVNRRVLSLLALAFALLLLLVQFLVAAFVTMNVAAAAIADEHERQTLPFLLLTPLSSREILFGKLAGRIVQVGALLLAGVPFLAFVQLFGGVEPALLVSAFAATAAIVFSQAGLGMLAGVGAKTVRQAQQRAGQLGLLITMVPMAIWIGCESSNTFRQFPRSLGWQSAPLVMHDIEPWANVGNPMYVVAAVVMGLDSRRELESLLWDHTSGFVLWHAALALQAFGLAVIALRRTAARMTGPAGTRDEKPKALARPANRPAVSDRPVLWRELHCRPNLDGRKEWHRKLTGLFIFASYLPVVWILFLERNSNQPIAGTVNVFFRTVGCLVLGAAAIQVGQTAANSIGRDRRQAVLAEILTTDLRTDEIQWQKWLAAVASAKWFYLWLGSHGAFALLLGGLSVYAIPGLLLSAAVLLAFAATAGSYFAARFVRSQTAVQWTALTLVGLSLAPFGICLVAYQLQLFSRLWADEFFLAAVGASPVPWAGVIAFSPGDLARSQMQPTELVGFLIGGGLQLVLYAGLTGFLWRRAVRRFAVTCRTG